MKEKMKKVLEWISNILVILVFVIAIFVLIGTVNQAKTGVGSVFGYVANTVQSDSMSGTFEEGDLIVSKLYDADKTELKVGDVVTFKQIVGQYQILNTHRIVEIQDINGSICYVTKGDNEIANDSGFLLEKDIVAIYQFRIAFVGSVIDWIKKPIGFILVLVVPILAFIGYQVYRVIIILSEEKKKKAVITSKDDVSDEVKQAIVLEYLKEMELKNKDKEEK